MSSTPSRIAVASASDRGYALPLSVMLYSVGIHLAPGVGLDAYVLDDGLAEEDKRRVEASVGDNTRIHWRTPKRGLSGLPVWGRMPTTTYQKLLLADWADSAADRVIWLDCDVLALSDIAPLWEWDLKGRPVGAVQDQRVPLISSRFGVAAWREVGLERTAKHFNAGVMLVDLARWRDERVSARAQDYLRSYGDRVYFWDQEALNAALSGQWAEVGSKWNAHPSIDALLAGRPASDPARDGILHFSGSMKPWARRTLGHALYAQFIDRTAWAGVRPRKCWNDAFRNWYATSGLRRMLYPAEQLALMAERRLTRRASL
jgi:lipopolysaccharide biosynthesis glycosyltransferase